MNVAIILSGGIGLRMGLDVPKQYFEINGKPIICWCLDVFCNRRDIDLVIIVLADEWKKYVEQHINKNSPKVIFALSGETRQLSILNGLIVAKENGCKSSDIVIIHDAVRPLVTNKIIDGCIDGIREGYDGVLPVIRVKDTIYYSKNGMSINGLLDRDMLFAGQSPESFSFEKYLSVHYGITGKDLLQIKGSTEIAYRSGLKIKLIDGDELNFKITTPDDLDRFKQMICEN